MSVAAHARALDTPALRRRCLDLHWARERSDSPDVHRRCWLDGLSNETWAGALRQPYENARVAPRGEHRKADDSEPPGQFTGVVPTDGDRALGLYAGPRQIRVRGYGLYRWAPRSSLPDGPEREPRKLSLAPRWRRGELLHAQQRRERALQRDVDAVREGWSYGVSDAGTL